MKPLLRKSFAVFFLLLTAAAVSISSPLTSPPVGWTVNDIDFNFKTTKSFDKAALLEVMFISKTKDFDQDGLEKDRQRIKKFYFDNGYFDAIVDTAVTYNKADNEVDIEIIIIENTRYTVREIVIRGLETIEDDLKKKAGSDRLLKPGDYYLKATVTKETNRILDILQNNGYLNARIDTSSRTEVAKYAKDLQNNPAFKNAVRITINFTGVNKKYTVGKTKLLITENKYSLDSQIVMREIKFHEGDLYSKEQVVLSEQNLTKLAIIQLGRIQIDTVDEATSRVDFNITVTLNKKYQITPSIVGKFIENYFYAGAGLQYDDKNFFGGGRVLSIKFEPLYHNKYINQISLSANILQPYLFRDNVTLNYEIELLFQNFNEQAQYLILSNNLTLNYILRKYVFYNNLSSQLNVDLIRLKLKYNTADANNQITENTLLLNVMNSVLGFSALHNGTNNIYNPSSGLLHQFTIEHAGLLPSLLNKISHNVFYPQYVRIYTSNSVYFDMTSGLGRKVFAIGSKIGDIIEYGSNENIIGVLSKYKFFSGGGNSVRGWGAQQNGMLKNTEDGGKFLLEGSFEYRWMLFGDKTNFLKDFGTVFFLDYGNVWESHSDFHFNQIAMAIGFGFRYYTFVGPIRIDFGVRLYDPKAEDGKKWLFQNFKGVFTGNSAIQFGLGNAF